MFAHFSGGPRSCQHGAKGTRRCAALLAACSCLLGDVVAVAPAEIVANDRAHVDASLVMNSEVSIHPHRTSHGDKAALGLGDGLLAYYPFDGDGTDHTGDGHDLELRAGATFSAGVVGSNALNTRNGYAVALDATGLDLPASYTVAAWVRKDGTAGMATVCGLHYCGEDDDGSWTLSLNVEGSSNVSFFEFPGGSIQSSGGVYFAANQWNHIAVAYDDQAVPSSTAYVYVNGALDRSLSWNSNIGGSAAEFTVGTDHLKDDGTLCGSNHYFQGEIDEIRIYDRALSAVEVSQLGGDCNSNGLFDGQDIAAGTSLDCNANTVPDECEIAADTSLDCNSNAILDSCDIAAGTSVDHDSNGVPDVCEHPRLCSPLAHYPFDGDVADYSGSGLHGAATGIPHVPDRHGYPDSAVYFDHPRDSRIALGNHEEFNTLGNAFTITFWTRIALFQGDIIIDHDVNGESYGDWTLGVHPLGAQAGKPYFAFGNNAEDATTAIDDDLWHHVAVRRLRNEELSFFIDGVLDRSIPDPGMDLTIWSTDTNLGPYDIPNWSSGFVGYLDDLRFYDQPLSGYEIAVLAESRSCDCNSNGILDIYDIVYGTSSDCSTDGVPDECQSDCNSNGVHDTCDIAHGTSLDCNRNLLPDECQVDGSQGDYIDCDSDGLPDACEESGLVAYWTFDEGVGSVAIDHSGHGNDLQLREGAGWSTGVVGGALDTRMGYAVANHASELELNRSYTIAAWVRKSLGGTMATVCGLHHCETDLDGSWVMQLTTEDGGSLVFVEFTDLAGAFGTSANVQFTAEEWSHVAIVYDDADPTGSRVYIYVDGVLDRVFPWTSEVGGSSAEFVVGTDHLQSGGGLCVGDHYFQGDIDELRVYNRALSWSEVLALQDCNANGNLDWCDLGGGTEADCNANGAPDACDIAVEWSTDCNSDGIPDECPLYGAIASRWISTNGLWSEASNWCPQLVPDNGPGRTYDVFLSGPETAVVLDMSPTVEALVCTDGAGVEVNTETGGDGRAIFTSSPEVYNDGFLRATEGALLLINTSNVIQSSNGVVEALGENVAGNVGSTVQIVGQNVVGGTARTEGELAAIELLGGAILENVRVEGNVGPGKAEGRSLVSVPDGQAATLSGGITNDGLVRVGTAENSVVPTFLAPDSQKGVQLDGTGELQLQSVVSYLGDFRSTCTNGLDHTISGYGVIYGDFVNQGIVEANVDQEVLVLSLPGGKTNEGTIRVSGGGVLSIEADLVGNSGLEFGGGEVHANYCSVSIDDDQEIPVGAIGIVNRLHMGASDFYGLHSFNVSGGSVTLDQNSSIDVSGPVDLCPAVDIDSNAISDFDILDADSLLNAADLTTCAGSRLDVSGRIELSGSLFNSGMTDADWSWATGSVLEMNGGQGMSDQSPAGYPTLEVGGLDVGIDPANHIGDSAGFVGNFTIAELVIGADAHVSLVDMSDNGSSGGPFGAFEALYVDTLTFADASARLNLNGLHLYYNHLNGDPAQIIDFGRVSADFNADGVVDLEDYASFAECLAGHGTVPEGSSGASTQHCLAVFDFDQDDDVDMQDFGVFQRYFGMNP